MSYRDPKSAPRDGTIIVGLFERPGRRALNTLAAYEPPDVEEAPGPLAPQWVHDAHARNLEQLQNDPTIFFRPISDGDETLDMGRMKGWRTTGEGK